MGAGESTFQYGYADMNLNYMDGYVQPATNTYGPWSEWSACVAPPNAPCGEVGTQKRTRQLYVYGIDPTPQPTEETRPCTIVQCPIDGKFSEWSEWSACDVVTCGIGKQTRTRTYTPPQFYGRDIEGPLTETKDCSKPCPIDGKFSPWSEWSSCNIGEKTCGDGQKIRTRTYTPPQFGGKDFEGALEEKMNCIIECDNPNVAEPSANQASGNQDGNQTDDESGLSKWMSDTSSGLKNWIWVLIGFIVTIFCLGILGYVIDRKTNNEEDKFVNESLAFSRDVMFAHPQTPNLERQTTPVLTYSVTPNLERQTTINL